MSVKYKLYQSKIAGSNSFNKWYAKTVVSGVVTLNEIAEKIQDNSSMKKSDVIAVLTELSEVFKEELLKGNRVVLDGIGSFKVVISSKPANTAKEWNVGKHFKRAGINYKPETIDIKTPEVYTRNVKALTGLKLEELKEYTVNKE